MKPHWILCLLLVGCESVPTPAPVPAPAPAPLPVAVPTANQRETEFETRLQQQRYVIDALLSQQEAQHEPPHELESHRPVKSLPPANTVSQNAVVGEPLPAKFLQPDGSGLIDLAVLTVKPAETGASNPFVVQGNEPAPIHETKLLVQGVLSGANPSAIVNDRSVEVGEAVDSLRLVRVEPDAGYFSAGEHLLRIPLGLPVRVRLP